MAAERARLTAHIGMFCIDTSVFITAHQQYYAFDLFPRFWRKLAHWGRRGRVTSCAAVLNELGSRRDALSVWATANLQMFPQPDLEVSRAYTQIVNFVAGRYQPQHAQAFLNGADPWVVAQALAHDLTVVTLESARQETVDKKSNLISGRVKLPNVCAHFKVSAINTFEMLRRLNFRC